MVKVLISLQTVIPIQESTDMENLTVEEGILGKTDRIMKVISKTE